MADALGNGIFKDYAFIKGAHPMNLDPYDALIARNWSPTLSVTGADGLPSLPSSGNVVRTHTTLKLSLRVPPRGDSKRAGEAIKKLLEKDPPYGAKVQFELEKFADGWDSPPLDDWLETSVNKASSEYFKKPCNYSGEGGSIPFMGNVGRKVSKSTICYYRSFRT